MTFQGYGVDWVTAMGPTFGRANVTLDSDKPFVYDLYQANTQWQVTRYWDAKTWETHHLKIQVLGTKNPSSKAKTVVIDAFAAQYGGIGAPGFSLTNQL